MGFLANLKAGIEAAQAASQAAAAADIPEFINPWPQEEVDRLLQGTGTIRAIVYGKRHQVLENGERVGSMRVDIRLRPRGPAGTLGDEVMVKSRLSSWNAALIERGLDIPVERDAATGAITKVASEQLTQELASREAEGKKRNPAWGLDPEIEGMIDVAKAIVGGPKPKAETVAPESVSDPRRQPVEGITWEAYVAVCAHLQVHGAGPDPDKVAQKYGVKAYTWAAISNVWKMRIDADPELAALFERDLAAASAAL